MLPRLLFVLLIALNIAVAAWLLLGANGHFVGDTADEGVPRLKLVAEVAVPVAAHTVAAAPVPAPVVPPPPPPATTAPSAPVKPPVASTPVAAIPAPSTRRVYRCMALGPFTSQADTKSARTTLGSKVIRSRTREEQTTASRGWRVFLPPQRTREQAQDMAKRLGEKNVKDYFVVPSGDEPNSIALGLFHDPANARKRRDEVIALGFPARMAERTEAVPAFWLDIVVADDSHLDWRSLIRAPGVGARAAGCF
jgi:hypothetical protein